MIGHTADTEGFAPASRQTVAREACIRGRTLESSHGWRSFVLNMM